AEDAVRVDRVLLRELAPEGATRAVHADVPDARVGAREVDELEDARRLALGSLEARQVRDLIALDADDFAGAERAEVARTDQVERARLARDRDSAVRQPAHDERPVPPRVARGVE